jgi:hypothetical protein
MHEFSADPDHAMCNIQSHSIPVVQLKPFKKLSIVNFKGIGLPAGFQDHNRTLQSVSSALSLCLRVQSLPWEQDCTDQMGYWSNLSKHACKIVSQSS